MPRAARAQPLPPASASGYDIDAIRAEFPALHQAVRGKPLVYLDSAATTQKPQAVLDAIARYYERDNANVHRGVHTLSARATESYEGARRTVARFLGASDSREIVFTRGTTEAINLVANALGREILAPGDEVLLTEMEHHSNIVPWQMIAEATGARVRAIPIDDTGELQLDRLDELLTDRTKILALVHVSNALGTINPVREIAARAREAGAITVVDGAQATAHGRVDVGELGVDFYAVSAHKMYGPTGVGALWGRLDRLRSMPPWQGGGDMIRAVSFDGTTFAEPPAKFEAGTPNIAGAVGWAAASDFLEAIDLDSIARHEADLLAHATERLGEIPRLSLQGTARQKAAVLSFLVDGIHPHDLGTVLDHEGVAIRTGHHCAQPVMRRFGVHATARASLGLYTTREEVDALVEALRRAIDLLA